jgi:hypothetical protein
VSERGRLRFAWRFGAVCASVCLSLSACRSSQARQLEAEVARLSHAIDSLRNAPNAGKVALLEALERAQCTEPEACQLKETCVTAYRRHRAAIEASERARGLLDARDGGTRAVLAAASELNQAEIELEHARVLTDRCSADEGALKRKVLAR